MPLLINFHQRRETETALADQQLLVGQVNHQAAVIQLRKVPQGGNRLLPARQVGMDKGNVVCQRFSQQVAAKADGGLKAEQWQYGAANIQCRAGVVDTGRPWLRRVNDHEQVAAIGLLQQIPGIIVHRQMVRDQCNHGIVGERRGLQLLDKTAQQHIGTGHRVQHRIAAILVTD